MATTQLIDGKAISEQVLSEITDDVRTLKTEKNIVPGLATVLVGQRKDSQTYVRMKQRAAARCGFFTVDVHLDDDVTEEKLLQEIDSLNQRRDVHGILVQLPLPKHINESKVLKRILVRKDVDGFSAENMGNIALLGGTPKAVPCTPAGVIELLKRTEIQIQGKKAVVLGRSNIVGLPVSLLLMRLDATVTIVHSRTKNIEDEVRSADIVIAAIGKAEFVRGSWLKPGCAVIDVGINFVEDSTKASGHRLVGDVCFEEAKGIASYITPVPGGVGPMTIAMLMKNTLNLARLEDN